MLFVKRGLERLPGLLGRDLHFDAGNDHEDMEIICLLFTFYRRCAACILEIRYNYDICLYSYTSRPNLVGCISNMFIHQYIIITYYNIVKHSITSLQF